MAERRPMIRNGVVVTYPAAKPVQATLRNFFAAHRIELDELLRPFGLTVEDIARPEFEQIVYEEDGRG